MSRMTLEERQRYEAVVNKDMEALHKAINKTTKIYEIDDCTEIHCITENRVKRVGKYKYIPTGVKVYTAEIILKNIETSVKDLRTGEVIEIINADEHTMTQSFEDATKANEYFKYLVQISK